MRRRVKRQHMPATQEQKKNGYAQKKYQLPP